LDRTYIKMLASICLVTTGILVALLLLSSGKAAADVDLVAKNSNMKFTVSGQNTINPTVNDAVTITIMLVNQGTDTNATGFFVTFSDGAALIKNVTVNQNVPYGGGVLNVTAPWTAKGPGVHTINIVVDTSNAIHESDETNNAANKNLDVNIAPHIVLNAAPITELTLNNILFNCTGSSDSDGNIVSYFWIFGDGSFDNKADATHAYKDNGIYTASLLITDNDGGTNFTKVQLTINNRPPTARATDQSALTYTTLWFDAANSTDADGSIVNISWHISGVNVDMYGKKVSYEFVQNGVYTVTLTVKDDDGATDGTTVFATINDRAPSAEIVANRTKINTTEWITFKGDLSKDKDGNIANYTWIFPGGINKYGPTVSYQFNGQNGSYLVTLVVTDDDGSIGVKSINIKVGNKKPVVRIGTNLVAQTYEVIQFDGSASYDPDGYIMNYTWDMGDGTKHYNSTFQYFYTNNNIYTVRLTIIDDEGAWNSSTLKVTVLNQAPVAFHSSIALTTYQNFWFNTSECTDKDGYIKSVVWVFHDPGGQQSTNNTNVTHMWKENGTYLVSMTITDDDGATDSYIFNVSIMNSNPYALFSYNPTAGISVGDDITFDASASKDVDGSIVNWVWNWGDGSQGSGETAHYAFKYPGLFKVTLTVIDNSGGSNNTFRVIIVSARNLAPIPVFQISAPDGFMTNRTIQVDSTGSYDPDGYITKWLWNFGDGMPGSGKAVGHKYTQPGTFTITLTIEDNGTKQNSTSQPVTLSVAPNLAPIASINTNGKTQVVANENMIFDGRASKDDDGSIVNYTWDFGDGTYKYSAYVTKAFPDTAVGTVTVKLTVRDNLGLTNTASVAITVLAPPKKNVPPTAQFTMTPPGPVPTGTEINFDASQSTDTDGTITGFTWLFGDGAFAEGKSVMHTYTNNQVFLVVLTVIDNLGGSGTVSKELTVSNRAPVAVIKVSKDSPLSLETITFDASGSYDPDGVIKSYTWIFGDEKVTKTGRVVTFNFNKPSNVKVTLKIVDDDGAVGTIDQTIKINNRPPVAKVGGDITVLEGEKVKLDGSLSKDPDGTIKSWHWALEGGLSPPTQEGMLVNIDAPTLAKGTDSQKYTIKLTVQDNNDALSNEAVFNLTVMKKPPIVKPPVVHNFIPGFDAVMALGTVAAVVSVLALRKRREA